MFKNLSPATLGASGSQSEIIELALTYGFAGMDLNIVDFATTVRLKGVAYARRLLESARLRIGTFPLPFDGDADDAVFQRELKKLPEYAECAAGVGCTRCTALVAPASDSRPYHENFEFHRRRFQEICAVLEPAGIRLAVGFQAAENLRQNRAFQFIHDLDALTLLLSMVGAPNLGLLFDLWEIAAGGGSVESVGKLPPPEILAVQVADMPADIPLDQLDEKSRLFPGEEDSRLDFAGFFGLLRDKGYDGPVTVQPSRSLLQGRRRDLIVKQMSESLDKIMRPGTSSASAKPVMTA